MERLRKVRLVMMGGLILFVLGFVGIINAYVPVPNDKERKDERQVKGQKGAKYVDGELLVRFKEGVADWKADAVHGRAQAHVVRRFKVPKGLYHVRMEPWVKMEEARETYKADPDVLYAEPNYIVEALAVPNDTYFSNLWGLHNTGQTGGTPDADINGPEGWDITTGSISTVIAVVDTGVDYTHEDLSANMWNNPNEVPGNGIDDDLNGYVDDVYGIDAVNNDSDPKDDHNHGTHVAGTIAGVGNNGVGVVGVNWNARIIACKFLDAFGFGSTAGAIECLNYLYDLKVNRGIDIVATNNSWGGGGYSQALLDAITAQMNAGILFVAAAGNSNSNNDQYSVYPAGYYLPSIISVAATEHNDDLTWFSNYGRRTVHVGAPGQDIYSTVIARTETVGLSYSDVYKLIYFSYGYEGINGASVRASVMQKVLNYFGLLPTDAILIVDDDFGAPYESYYTSALTTLGYTNYNVTTVPFCSDGPSAITMSGYRLVIWFTGDFPFCTLTIADQFELQTFLDNGGNLFITGEDIGYDISRFDPLNFYSTYLKAEFVSDMAVSKLFDGVGVFAGEAIDLTCGGDGACNQFYIDIINPLNGALPTFEKFVSYASFSGTSMSAPHVTGLVALLKSQDPSRNWIALKNLVLAGGQDKSATTGKTITGKRIRLAGPGSLDCTGSVVISRLMPISDTISAIVGDSIGLSVLHVQCAEPNGDVVVYIQPTGEQISLTDDGIGFDQVPGDGIYSGQWSVPALGDYILNFPDASSVEVWGLQNYLPATQVPFNYRYISGTNLNLGDDQFVQLTSTFPILFGNNASGFTNLNISSNGNISFTDSAGDYSNTSLPTMIFNTVVSAFWDDLNPSAGGGVYWDVLGSEPNRELVVEWRDVPHYSVGGAVKFEVVFFEESPNILFNYSDVVFGDSSYDYGASATVGVQVSKTAAQQYSFNTISLSNSLALMWSTSDLPPSAPTGLVATAGDSQVQLDWNDNIESDLSHYNVKRSMVAGGPYTQIATAVSSYYTDEGLTNGTTYYYVVTAVDNGSNESANSNEVSATPIDMTPPSAPTGLGAVPGDRKVILDWNDNTEPDFASYNVKRSTTAGGPYTQIATSTVSSYTDTGVINNTTYYYVVTALDMVSNESANSNEASATPIDITPPSAPTGLTATPGNAQVILDWADNTETDLAGYNVYRSSTTGGPYTKLNASLLTASTYLDTTVTNGLTYYYVVTAVDDDSNESGYSSEVRATPNAYGDYNPPLVDILQPTTGSTVSGTVTIKASASDDKGILRVEYQIDGTGAWTLMKAGKGANAGTYSATWDSTTVTNGPHTITVRAIDINSNISTDSISVNVSNVLAGTMHVASIDMSIQRKGQTTNAVAVVTIVDTNGSPVSGATVSGHWSGLTSDTDTGTTDSTGKVTLKSDSLRNPSGTFTFTVDNVTKSGWTYNPTANIETSDSISI